MSYFWLQYSRNTGPLNMAQDEQNFRSLISSAIFISDQPKLDYLKTRILHRALFSNMKMIFVTHYFTFLNQKLNTYMSLLLSWPPPPQKKELPFLWVHLRLTQRWMALNICVLLIENPIFSFNLKALDRAVGPVQRFWALHAHIPNHFWCFV